MTCFAQIDITFVFLKEDIDYLESYAKRRPVDTNIMCSPGKSFLQPEPFGVVLVLGAWNYPLTTAIHPCISAIAAGNAVILKPSEVKIAPLLISLRPRTQMRWLNFSRTIWISDSIG